MNGLVGAARPAPRRGRACPEPLATALELAARVEAFTRFRWATAEAERGGLTASAALRRGRRLDPWAQLWLHEGFAYGWAGRMLKGGRPTARLAALLRSAPEELRLPLHTGVGMTLAKRFLDRERFPGPGSGGPRPMAGSGLDRRSVARVLRRMRRAVAEVSVGGMERAAFEPLGFVARTVCPWVLPGLGRELARGGSPAASAALWHGAGRGLYFVPQSLRPGVAAGVFHRAVREALGDDGRCASLAGAAWALTLVNLRTPGVVTAALEREVGRCTPAERDAALSGGASAATLWWRIHGRDRRLEALLETAPALRDPFADCRQRLRRGGEAELVWRPGLAPATPGLADSPAPYDASRGAA